MDKLLPSPVFLSSFFLMSEKFGNLDLFINITSKDLKKLTQG